jgi:hypothetical protein
VSWFKKGNFIALGAAAGLVGLFLCLFLDPLLKRGLISVAQSAAKAKVDVGTLSTSLRRGELVIRSVTVADKSEPMKNVVEFGEAKLAFKPSAALKGRLVIADAALTGLRFGTPRKTSGALRASDEPSKVESAVRGSIAPGVEQAKTEARSAAKLEASDLKSLAGLEEAEAKLKDVESRWKTRLEKFKNVGKVDAFKALSLIKEAEAANRELRADLEAVQSSLRKAEELRNKDLQGLLAMAGVPSFDAESLTRRLLGPELADKTGKALYWAQWLKNRASAGPKKKPEARPRRQGVDVDFAKPGSDPAFLLAQARLSGEHAGMTLDGRITDVASDGRTSRLKLEGKGSGRVLTLLGSVDAKVLDLNLLYGGLPLSGLALGEGDVAAAVAAGSAKVNAKLRITERWKGEAVLDASGVKLEPKVSLPGTAGRAASSALSGLRSFSARVGVEGVEDDLRFSVSSDLGKTLAASLRNAATAEAEVKTRELRAQLDGKYQPKLRELQARQAELLKPFEGNLKGLLKKR